LMGSKAMGISLPFLTAILGFPEGPGRGASKRVFPSMDLAQYFISKPR
jgi:hypothetical protein